MQALAQAVLGQGATALEKQMPPPKADGSSTWREQIQAALVAIDNPSGRVIAWVSGVGLEDSPIDRVRRLPRRPGTALLPLVYTAAVEQGMTQANRVWDAPFDLPAGDGAAPYPIKNPSDRFEGEITFRRAVEREARIPAVKVLGLVGLETFLQTARALGLDTPLENDLSAALGRMPKTLLELTSAYHAIQNGGVYVSPYGVHQVKDRGGRSMDAHPPTRRIAVSPETAYIVTDMLAGSFRAHGPGSDIPLDRPLAGVSGTVEEGTDAWFIGYSPELTVGVWVGLDSGSPLPAEAEAKGAARALWLEFMRRALADQPPRDFSRPPGIVQVFIDPVSGRRTHPSDPAGVSAAFRAGTSPE
jgi:penicillin-binding protein 1A